MWRHGIVYVLLFFSSSLAYSQCLESELAAPQSNVNAYYGAAVAIDGDRAVVGANERAAVYRLQGAQWLPEAVLAVPDADGFASSVALDDDVLVCGAHVFRRSGNAWAFDGELTPGDSGSFGSALDIALVVDKVKDIQGAIPKRQADLANQPFDPLQPPNASDIAAAVDAVKGLKFTGGGPQPCP